MRCLAHQPGVDEAGQKKAHPWRGEPSRWGSVFRPFNLYEVACTVGQPTVGRPDRTQAQGHADEGKYYADDGSRQDRDQAHITVGMIVRKGSRDVRRHKDASDLRRSFRGEVRRKRLDLNVCPLRRDRLEGIRVFLDVSDPVPTGTGDCAGFTANQNWR